MAKPGTVRGESRQEGGSPPDGEALVAGLRGCRDCHLVDAPGGKPRVAAHQFADAFDHQVVCTHAGVNALVAGPAERCAHAVHEDDVADNALVSAASVLAHVLLLIETLVPDPAQGSKESERQ